MLKIYYKPLRLKNLQARCLKISVCFESNAETTMLQKLCIFCGIQALNIVSWNLGSCCSFWLCCNLELFFSSSQLAKNISALIKMIWFCTSILVPLMLLHLSASPENMFVSSVFHDLSKHLPFSLPTLLLIQKVSVELLYALFTFRGP